LHKICPPYIPFSYRQFLVLRKVYRQSRARLAEMVAKKLKPENIIPDGTGVWPSEGYWFIADNPAAINKCARWIDEDLSREAMRSVRNRMNELKKTLKSKRLSFCSPAGTFVPETYLESTQRRKDWENYWIIAHSGVKKGDQVLDIGGASTLFAFYLAGLGCQVNVIDNDWGNCATVYNTNYVAKKMKWNLTALDRDISKPLPFPDNHFDCVFSICVIEHLPSSIRRFMMKEVARVLKPGGMAGLTTDYDHQRKVLLTDKGLRFAYYDKLSEDIIKPSGLQIYGNTDFVDAFDPKENFLGAFFLMKNR